MARRELHSDSVKPDQKRVVVDPADREGEVILVDPSIATKDYNDALAFMEEPVTIRLQPSNDLNAVSRYWVCCNGIMAEMLINNRWRQVGWLPVGPTITVKRKYLEIIAGSKLDNVRTEIHAREGQAPLNEVRRQSSAAQVFSVIEDRNPRGAAWMTEMLRRP